ncbi:MAG TPA: hypothetical protein VM888_07130 [Chitinophagaceae bacterium]|jgi:hypothetical protein|nr:hypothetical protein [Chitinophagaceae bacterium]
MKDHATAQAILQTTGHPLEPIVAFELNKAYQKKLSVVVNNSLSPYLKDYQVNASLNAIETFGEDWFNNYE